MIDFMYDNSVRSTGRVTVGAFTGSNNLINLTPSCGCTQHATSEWLPCFTNRTEIYLFIKLFIEGL